MAVVASNKPRAVSAASVLRACCTTVLPIPGARRELDKVVERIIHVASPLSVIHPITMSAPSPQLNLAFLLPPSWKQDIPRWYHEDTPSFDWAGLVVGDEEQEAILWAKSGGVLAGVPFFDEIFRHVDCT